MSDVEYDRKLWDELRAKAKKLDDAFVRVGVLEGRGSELAEGSDITLIELAATHEFGSSDGRIKERSFIRSTFEVNFKDELREKQTELARAIVTKGLDPIRALGLLGAWGAAKVKQTIVEKLTIGPESQANADSTIKAKGSSTPLVDTGQLKNSITHLVVERGK